MNSRFTRLLLILVALTFLTACGCPARYLPGDPEPLQPFLVPERIRVALVLGAGGVRGMAHIGVLEELEKAGIEIDVIIGCSAGSIVGALYCDNPCVDKIKKAVWKIRTNKLVDVDIFNCRFGLSQGDHFQRILDENLHSETFDQLKIPLIVVATDLISGELVPIATGPIDKAVRASSSMPFVFVPCKHMGRLLVDGGVVDSVPVKVACSLGAEVIIAVDLAELLPHTLPTNLFGVLKRSTEIAFMWHNEICTHHSNIIIRPKTCGVGSFNEKMKWKIYQAGKEAAREKIPEILEIIAKYPPSKRPCPSRLMKLDCFTPQIYQMK